MKSFTRLGQTDPKVDRINEWLQKYSIDDPAAPEYDHVVILFSDGEISMTKAGSLFGQRRLSMQRRPVQKLPPQGIEWPNKYSGHPCVIVESVEIAEALYDKIWGSESRTPQEVKREEALEEIFKKMRENKKDQPKQTHPKDTILKLGFEKVEGPNQDRYKETYQKGDIKVYFEDGSLKAIDDSSLPKKDTGGTYRDAHWYSIVTPDAIWLHPKGWFGLKPDDKALRQLVDEIRNRSGSSNVGFTTVEQTSPEELESLGFVKVANSSKRGSSKIATISLCNKLVLGGFSEQANQLARVAEVGIFPNTTGLKQSYQKEFEPKIPCHACGKMADLAFVIAEEPVKEDVDTGESLVSPEAGYADIDKVSTDVAHDVASFATYVCPECFEATTEWNQA